MPFVAGPGTERDDVADDLVPVLWVNSELEGGPDVRPDAGKFRYWEVAGTGHVDHWWHSYVNYHMWPRDHGSAAGVSVDREWNAEREGQYGERGSSPCPSNYYPFRHPLRAATHHLNEWVKNPSNDPPTARLEYDDSGDVKQDEHMNAVGGVRTPAIDVPVATYDATRCGLHGQTIQFDPVKIEELYSSHEDYVEQFRDAADAAVNAGWLLRADARDLVSRAEASNIGDTL